MTLPCTINTPIFPNIGNNHSLISADETGDRRICSTADYKAICAGVCEQWIITLFYRPHTYTYSMYASLLTPTSEISYTPLYAPLLIPTSLYATLLIPTSLHATLLIPTELTVCYRPDTYTSLYVTGLIHILQCMLHS